MLKTVRAYDEDYICVQDRARIEEPLERSFRDLLTDQRGSALTEYALISALFALALLATLHTIQNEAGNNLTRTGNGLTNMSYTP